MRFDYKESGVDIAKRKKNISDAILAALEENPLHGIVIGTSSDIYYGPSVLERLKLDHAIDTKAVVHFYRHITDDKYLEVFSTCCTIIVKLNKTRAVIYDPYTFMKESAETCGIIMLNKHIEATNSSTQILASYLDARDLLQGRMKEVNDVTNAPKKKWKFMNLFRRKENIDKN